MCSFVQVCIKIFCPFRSFLPGLRECVTDDDVAMHLIKHTEEFEKYLHYMVGQAQAEGCVSDKAVQQYFNVCIKESDCFKFASPSILLTCCS